MAIPLLDKRADAKPNRMYEDEESLGVVEGEEDVEGRMRRREKSVRKQGPRCLRRKKRVK